MITAAGADFQNAVMGLRIEGLGHEGDNVGLRDGLAMTDG